GKAKMFGDFRFRAEMDDSQRNAGTVDDRERNKLRFRARLGVKFAPADNWSAKIRMSTNVKSLNSPHEDFSTATSARDNFGLDQAYFAYSKDNTTLIGGRTPLNIWKTSEVTWDDDLTADAVAAVYKMGGLTVNAAFSILTESGWGNADDTLTMLQGVYKAGDIKAGLAMFNINSHGAYQSDNITVLNAQYKPKDWRVAIEILSSDADTEDMAYVAQYRRSFEDGHGMRLYYYHVEAFSVPGDGAFSQDNFPTSGNTGGSNFEGFRLQYDYKIEKNVAMDVRYYQMETVVDDSATLLAATASDAIFTENDGRSRIQVNLNLKF
ncbi:MAG: putative porin, partial [Gammaproteobacteria bacterium]